MCHFMEFLIVLSALVTVVSGLECVTCFSLDSTSCTGESETCPTDYVCASVYQNSFYIATFRSCQPQSKCDIVGSIVNTAIKVDYVTTCCTTDNCTPPSPSFPSTISTLNGLKCPSCISGSSSCSPTETVLCQGNQNMCVSQTTLFKNAHQTKYSALRGCSSTGPCDVASFFAVISDTWISTTFSCTTATSVSSSSLNCVSCMTYDGTSCKGMSVECPDNHLCGSSYMLVAPEGQGDVYTVSVIRSCLPQNKCNSTGSITYFSSKVYMAQSCCSTENCFPSEPLVPEKNAMLNGLSCPTCYSVSSISCTSPDTIQCRGSENMCVYEAKTMSGPFTDQEAIRGCGTNTLCDGGSFSTTGGGITLNMTFTCLNARIPGSSLSCTRCMKMGGSDCEGPSVICSPDEACGALRTISSADGEELLEVYGRDCVPKKDCDIKGSYTVADNIKSKVALSCCYTDNCTPPQPNLPDDSYEPNGVTCRTCFSPNSDWCNSTTTIDCQGDENMCILQSMRIKGPVPSVTALRGCATKCFCDGFDISGIVNGMSLNFTMSCTATEYF